MTPAPAGREAAVLARIEQRRCRPAALTDPRITLAHGSGGTAMRRLIEALFLDAFRNPALARLEDQAVLPLDAEPGARLAFATDSFVVTPLFFPGGDIGHLAVNGTVNDLAVSGAIPRYLSAGFILEEGFPMDDLRRIVRSMAEAATAAGVEIVTGDTKVVHRGKADGVFINTAGIGFLTAPAAPSAAGVRPGDAVLLSGPIADHGMAILVARGDLELDVEIRSDTAPLTPLVGALLQASDTVRCLRDPTRGGVAAVLNEIALQVDVAIEIEEARIPVREEVRGACELLGIDPLYVASEGRLLAIVGCGDAELALAALRSLSAGADAAIIGEVRETPKGHVLMRTAFGGTRLVDMLAGDPLPRIC